MLTQTEFQADIERELAAGTLPANLRFDIYTPGWLERIRDTGLRWGFPSLTWHLVSVLWQFCALFHARGRYKQADFDLIHHVSFAGIRHPTLLTRLGCPRSSDRLEAGKQLRCSSARPFLGRTGAWSWCAMFTTGRYALIQ